MPLFMPFFIVLRSPLFVLVIVLLLLLLLGSGPPQPLNPVRLARARVVSASAIDAKVNMSPPSTSPSPR